MDPKFKPGQIVALKANPQHLGTVSEVLPNIGGKPRYRVFHSVQEILDYHEDQLQEGVAATPKSEEGVPAMSPAEFLARLTAARLSHPQVDSLYSLYAARIMFVPFQFKPLLRFLRAEQPRLLIADEVGVGKTIEAGLILRELQARQRLGNVLIVCPKALAGKWQKEMRRFDESFRRLNADSLRYCIDETELDGVWPAQYARAICHLELLRVSNYLNGPKPGRGGRAKKHGLLTLSPPPRFDLLIVDEAHHLRNPGTSSHEVGRFLCDVSDAAIFLSATPIHLGSRNLFSLLSLLRPDSFPVEGVFDEMIEPNAPMTRAMRHLRTRSPRDTWAQEASDALDEAAETSWGQRVLGQDTRFKRWSGVLRGGVELEDTSRIEALRDLEECHSLSHYVNRTRRRDVGKFTIREPRTVTVPFTLPQQAFYQALVSFRRDILLLDYGEGVVRLIIDTLERQAASCLPALLPTLDGFIRTGRFNVAAVSDAPELDEADLPFPEDLKEKARALRQAASALPTDDPKLEQLAAIAKDCSAEGEGKKLLVFTFFLHTLDYLARELAHRGFRVGVVSGKVKEELRDDLRERFRLPANDPECIDILLCSEVGSEGLDYEHCDRMVNYDIPWNPMRIEQRIGRIDRFGQQSDKVLIFNFITPGRWKSASSSVAMKGSASSRIRWEISRRCWVRSWRASP